MRESIAYTIRSLLSELCESPGELTNLQREQLGKTARRLLEFAWQREPRDQWLIIHALQTVCRTFESDGSASADLLRCCLGQEHIAEYGFQELPWLTGEIERLIPLDPELVEDIYIATFGYSEKRSDLKTGMGSGRILPLTSTASQDYEHAHYQLSEIYPTFLNEAPVRATKALISALDTYVAERHFPSSEEIIGEKFNFNDREATIRTDYSAIWDSGADYTSHDDPIKMLNAFEEYLRRISDGTAKIDERQKILDTLNGSAVLWRRLLRCGTTAPTTLGHEIRSLAWGLPILKGIDTTIEVGDFLLVIFSLLTVEEQERVEQAILSIPNTSDQEDQDAAEDIRNRLIGCLPPELVRTTPARVLIQELNKQKSIPPNEPLFRISTGTSKAFGERGYLAEQGVPAEEEQNQRVQRLEQPVKEFIKNHTNSFPAEEDVRLILRHLQELHTALQTAQTDGVHPKQRDHAWDTLAEACEYLTKTEAISHDTELGVFVREALLGASVCQDPPSAPESDTHFDKSPSWGRPAARIPAAIGITWLAHHVADEAVLEAIERLSKDAVPAVRLQVASHLIALHKTAPDLMWSILERMCSEEPSRSILQALLVYPLNRLSGLYADRVSSLARIVFNRTVDGDRVKKVRESCVSIFTGLTVWQDHSPSREVVNFIADQPTDFSDEAHCIITYLRDLMTHGPLNPPEPEQDKVRRRSISLMNHILRSVINSFQTSEEDYRDTPFDSLPDEEQKRRETIVRLAVSISREIYFSSGAYEGKKSQSEAEETEVNKSARKRFLEETKPILHGLADFGFPRLVYDLLQTLEFLLVSSPEEVFLLIRRVVCAGDRYRYQYDSLAADLNVRLVERFLAEYRHVLRESEECRNALVEILNIFVAAGWPSARRLTYRLEEIWR